ncbi:AAA family ATPase [Tunturiibacter gelidoferens]|uniref:ATPase n=1 Tax=Tunturiibacter gelidiferens TaxID=3069689 RepID=A0ACC5P383_9BACT|nr:AAA family ATPase [Edaphobacter lichenicola]MBB5341314.1 putative ATPase [Edaphobacter lichenicola]
MLKKITLLRERVEDWTAYPFSVPTIASLPEISHSRIAFFAGENGTGKSTFLEAIAAHYGFGPEGGNRNIRHDTTEHNHSTDSLVRALRLSFDKRTGAGFHLNVANRRVVNDWNENPVFVSDVEFVQGPNGKSPPR